MRTCARVFVGGCDRVVVLIKQTTERRRREEKNSLAGRQSNRNVKMFTATKRKH